MYKWICRGCSNPCLFLCTNEDIPKHCTIWNGDHRAWVRDTSTHKPVDCRSYVCEKCHTNPCYHVKLGASNAQENRSCCPIDGSEANWRPLE